MCEINSWGYRKGRIVLNEVERQGGLGRTEKTSYLRIAKDFLFEKDVIC